ncbi:MAG: hypothetical protein ACC661_00425 [Verrucomicrobiales bacterium]
MRTGLLVLIGIGIGMPVWSVHSEEAPASIGILPEQKNSVVVTETDRNPFAARSEAPTIAAYDKESEESQIRRIFSGLHVNGVSETLDGYQRVLLGDMILEKGKRVPQLIPEQTEILIVSDITKEQIELAWLDAATSRFDSRTLLIPIQLNPTVEYVLRGQSGAGSTRRRATKTFDPENLEGRRYAGSLNPVLLAIDRE